MKYQGEWKNNQMNGKGKLSWEPFENGRTYEGNFVNDEKDGYGIQIWTDGRKFDGEWKAGQLYKGTFTRKDGTRIVGEFRDGKPIGECLIYPINGSPKRGNFSIHTITTSQFIE